MRCVVREIDYLDDLVVLLILRAADGSIGRLASKWDGGPSNPGFSLRLIGPTPAAVLRMPMLNEGVVLAYGDTQQTSPPRSAGLTRAAEVREDVLMSLGALFVGGDAT